MVLTFSMIENIPKLQLMIIDPTGNVNNLVTWLDGATFKAVYSYMKSLLKNFPCVDVATFCPPSMRMPQFQQPND